MTEYEFEWGRESGQGPGEGGGEEILFTPTAHTKPPLPDRRIPPAATALSLHSCALPEARLAAGRLKPKETEGEGEAKEEES